MRFISSFLLVAFVCFTTYCYAEDDFFSQKNKNNAKLDRCDESPVFTGNSLYYKYFKCF